MLFGTIIFTHHLNLVLPNRVYDYNVHPQDVSDIEKEMPGFLKVNVLISLAKNILKGIQSAL